MAAVFMQAAFVFAGDILYVTNSDAETVSVIDGETGVVIREVSRVEPCDIAIDPKGDTIAVSHEERQGEVWFLDRKDLNVQGITALVEEKDGRAGCFFLAFSRDSKKLYAANRYSGFSLSLMCGRQP